MRLRVPGEGVRPTTDRTKSALFSWLGETVQQARVLDLFAGTGSLGIEALSRGAANATFVESSRDTLLVLKKNLTQTRLSGQADVRESTVGAFLRDGPRGFTYNLIFCDPPWIEKGADRDWVGWILEQQHLLPFLAPRGWFILEAPSERRLETGPFWQTEDKRRYGTTTLYYLRPASSPAATQPVAPIVTEGEA